jgi:putative ABC transport system permease protein
VAILTLALGIAANTVIFSVIYATFLEPLPYRDADQLVMAGLSRGQRIPASPVEFVEWQRQATGFANLNAWSWWTAATSIGNSVEHLQIAPATPSFSSVSRRRCSSPR